MPNMPMLPQGSKPPPRCWNRPHFWHQGISLSLASPSLPLPYSDLTAPLVSHLHPHLSQALPKACCHPGPRSLGTVFFSLFCIKKQTS